MLTNRKIFNGALIEIGVIGIFALALYVLDIIIMR